MSILDSESKKDIFELIDKFTQSPLFELEIYIPPPQPQGFKIKMMKLAQDNDDAETTSVKVTVEGVDGTKENIE